MNGESVREPTWSEHPDGASMHRPAFIKVYAASSAMEWRQTRSRRDVPTIELDAAAAAARVAGAEPHYVWDKKITLQFTARELPALALTLGGRRPECEFRHHGLDRNKSFRLVWQGGQMLVTVAQGAHTIRTPMSREDAFYVELLVLQQLRARIPGIDGATLRMALDDYARITVENGNLPPANLAARAAREPLVAREPADSEQARSTSRPPTSTAGA